MSPELTSAISAAAIAIAGAALALAYRLARRANGTKAPTPQINCPFNHDIKGMLSEWGKVSEAHRNSLAALQSALEARTDAILFNLQEARKDITRVESNLNQR